MSAVIETQVAKVAEGLVYLAKLINKLSNTDKANRQEYSQLTEQLQTQLNSIDLSEVIDDTKSTSRDQTYSINQINLLIKQSKDEILGGEIPDALNTLQELIAEISDNDTGIAAALANQAKRVAVDQVQNFTLAEQARARTNMSAVSQKDHDDFKAKIGDVDFNFVDAIKETVEAGDLPE